MTVSVMDLARRRNWDFRPGQRRPLEERFWEKVFPEPNTGCWLWGGSDWRRYGTFTSDGKTRGAHRVAYELVVGPIPPGMQIDHLCRQTYCVRPDHLEAVTPKVNIARSMNPNMRVSGTGFCRRGHVVTEADRAKNGRSRCLECRRLTDARRKDERGEPRGHHESRKTSCPRGHPYDMVTKAGARRCRRCKRDQTNAARAALRAAKAGEKSC